jgi:ATP-dependent DNA helicase DinG
MRGGQVRIGRSSRPPTTRCGSSSPRSRAVILTSTKALQDQYAEEFASMGLIDVRGQNAYPCRALLESGHVAAEDGFALLGSRKAAQAYPDQYERTTCDEGPCHYGARCQLHLAGCHYYDQVRRATRAELVVTNYAFWLTTNAYRRVEKKDGTIVQGIGAFDLLICDEAHDAPAALSAFLTSTIDPADVRELLGVELPAVGISTDAWREWARGQATVCEDLIDHAKIDVRNAARDGGDTRRAKRRLRKLQGIGTAIERLSTPCVEWIVEPAIDPETRKPSKAALPALTFAPLWPGSLAEAALFQGIPKVLLMSATITPKTMTYLGVQRQDFAFWEEPSSFPVARRPVYQYGKLRLRYPEDDLLPWLVRYIDEIIKARPGVRGIIHCGAFWRGDYLLEHSQYAHRMITHKSASWRGRGRSLAEALVEYRTRPITSEDGVWLVSPSVTTGYDFTGDQCRVQIVAKVPFPDSGSALIKARMKKDGDYTNYLALQTLVQAVGRSVRSEADYAETFIVDRQIDWLLGSKYHHLSPQWFREAVKEIAVVPAPLSGRLGR